MNDASRPRERSALTGFATNPLDRRGDQRDQPDAVARYRAGPGTRHAIVAGETPILRRIGPESLTIWFDEAQADGVGKGLDDLGHPLRVLPEVGVERAVVVAVVDTVLLLVVSSLVAVVVVGAVGGQEGDELAHVQHPVGAGLLDGVVDGGLESLQVDDEVGLGQGGDLAGGEFEVVGLGAGGREGVDGAEGAERLRGGPLERVERRDDPRARLAVIATR